MEVKADEILTIIGPSNSGKTTFLRILNRMHELNPVFRMQGRVQFNGSDISTMEVGLLRKKIGMVFALPLPLPFTIYENITYALKMHGIRNRSIHMERAEKALRQASLWNEVKDRLKTSAFKLSGGQQQRLCIARTLALEPDVILFDEPCSGLDPISTAKVEEAMFELKKEYTIVLVTNNVKQAARVGDKTAFFLNGELIELDKTEKIFTVPSDQRTDDYIRGKFG
ncbi:MAG: phosphate ABC transporter ATP-binding protein [Candidatus Aureabacteria bacterium]|nr:phosphate ABC transporter ATP-binding protein [Candidatus Auribacterota bacterium]